MAPKKSKAAKVSTGIPEWISEQAATEHADEFLSTLAQEQMDILSPVYSPFPITLRGPYQTPFLGPTILKLNPKISFRWILSWFVPHFRTAWRMSIGVPGKPTWDGWVKVPMKASKAEILRLKTYSGFMMTFQESVPAKFGSAPLAVTFLGLQTEACTRLRASGGN
ncbi:hypothetical protein Pyn_21491 [Prunus yedoensis var. nudiflora]|uniref:Uncharacterized protein n=1 Tax=Prunus yedoensis var. nudiflora TaxID=2094558 RepID=A0A314U9M7_PRUYE|nr:hypothetical protein Pyn_21491 [Prunus yedoensis var. nudiflora]